MPQRSLDLGRHIDGSSANLLENTLAPLRQAFHFSTMIVGNDGQNHALVIKVAAGEADRAAARSLLNKRYGWRGYGESHSIPTSATHSTFTAYIDGELVGTLTLGVDSSAGMEIDHTFRNELNTYRRVPGAQLCELTKFAFETSVQSKAILAAFFHFIFIYGECRYDCTDLFIEVNPRHRRFYEAMLGFDRVGGLKENEGVGAPSQLMHLEVAQIRAQVAEYTRAAGGVSERSLYPFFLSGEIESDVRLKMERGGLSASQAHRAAAIASQRQPNAIDAGVTVGHA